MKIVTAWLVLLISISSANAAEMPGFPRDDFGKIVLLSRQVASGIIADSFGNYNNEPIDNYNRSSILYRLGKPVGRLDIRTDAGVFPCTGFLVSSKHIVTNYHCVPGMVDNPRIKRAGAKRIEHIQFVLGYTRPGVVESVRRFTVARKPLEADKELDYALLKVAGNPAKSFGWLPISTETFVQNAPLWIIGHPLGEAQRISREQCKSGDPAISGGRLRHTCDTLPGNSGSPVLDPDRKTVIALHHAGSELNSINYAIPFSRIVRRSKILSTLVNRQPAQPHLLMGPLGTEPPPLVDDDPKVIARDLQMQLQRVGCYNGDIDGLWGPGSKSSLASLQKAQRIQLSAPVLQKANVEILRDLKQDICVRNAAAKATSNKSGGIGKKSSPPKSSRTGKKSTSAKSGNGCFVFGGKTYCQ